MKIFKFLACACFLTLISCNENKLAAQKTHLEQKGEIEKIVATDFNSKIEGKTVQLIDVRTPGEYSKGHILNARNVNFYDTDFLSQLSTLDKSKPIFLYCKSGGRSGKASTQLKDAGFTQIYDLKGGFTGWKTAGLPIKK